MIRNRGDNMVENVIIPKYMPSTHCVWNIVYKEYIMAGFREE